MSHYQPGILAKPVPLQARHLFFALESAEALPAALDNLTRLVDVKHTVVGFGESLVLVLVAWRRPWRLAAPQSCAGAGAGPGLEAGADDRGLPPQERPRPDRL